MDATSWVEAATLRGCLRRLKLGLACLLGLAAMFSLVPAASAGPTYVLDRARTDVAPTTDPGIVRVVAGVQTRLLLTPGTPPPNLPLTAPAGIDVDETTGDIYVTDSEGYTGGYDFEDDDCGSGVPVPDCGALLRVDPDNGTTELVAGPTLDPNDNFLPNPYGVLVRPPTDALVADPGRTAVVSVNLATGVQTLFNEKSTGGDYPGGLRSPWGVAQDPSGDILVVNAGNPAPPPCVPGANGFCPGEFDIPVPANCRSDRGYVLRYTSTGQQEAIYCSASFVKPRHAAVAADGTIFVTDPFASEGANEGFGTIFEIDPASGAVEPVTQGGSLATASGIDFNVSGDRLLLSDETLFPYGSGGCPGGCGGVVQVNPLGGDQAVIELREAGGDWIDPIDLAVDRDGAPAPSLGVDTAPQFLQNLGRDEGAQASPTSVKLLPVRSGSTVTVICAEVGCEDSSGRQLKRSYMVPAGQNTFDLQLLPFEYRACSGNYRLLGTRCCPPKTRLKGSRCVPKGKKKKKGRSADGSALSSKRCKPKKCGKPASTRYSFNRQRVDVKGPGLPNSRFIDISIGPTVISLPSPVGCANAATELDLVVPSNPVACPPP